MNTGKRFSYFHLEVEVAEGFPFVLKEHFGFQHLLYVMEGRKSRTDVPSTFDEAHPPRSSP